MMQEHEEFDYIVVGAGSSGAALAARLSQKNPQAQVALVEAGPDDAGLEQILQLDRWMELLESGYDWDYPIEPQENGNSFMRMARAKVLGGCSSHNSCIAFWAPAEDMDDWENKYGASGWNSQMAFRLFKELETNQDADKPGGEHHGSSGPVPIMNVPGTDPCGQALLEACQQAGIPRAQFNSGKTVVEGANFFQINRRADGTRGSSSVSYLHPIRDRENLHLLTDTQVKKILFDNNKRAVGLEVVAHAFGRESILKARAEIIISAGAIDTPKLLMLSGIGPAEHLKDVGIEPLLDAPGVGQNLQDHPEAVIQWQAKKPMVRQSTQWWEIGIFTNLETGMQEHFSGRPNFMMHYGSVNFDMHTLRRGMPGTDNVFCLTPNVPHARSRGTVRLRSMDFRDKPMVDPRYFTDPEGYDMKIMVEGIRKAREIASQPALADWTGKEEFPGEQLQSDQELAAYVRDCHNTVYHPVGTVRMGADRDELAPLDARLRVKGVSGLRVADASIMPEITTVNPNITCYMIGERAAELITEDAKA